MKKWIPLIALTALILAAYAFINKPPSALLSSFEGSEEMHWYSWEDAIEAQKKEPKKLLVDVYTDWCGWCKRMDKNTFSNPKVQAYIEEHFYPVKFNAEQKEDIHFQGETLKWVPNGRRGYHELAAALLDGRLSFPSLVYLNEKQERITISPGYKDVNQLMKEMKYIAEEHYQDTPWEEFQGKK